MIYTIQELTEKLKATRKKKGLSQRKFAKSIGMQQSQVSRIENGTIDLQTSTLMEMARSLDLELLLVPRSSLPAVNSFIRQIETPSQSKETKPVYTLDDEDPND